MSIPTPIIDLSESESEAPFIEEDPALAEASEFYHLMHPPYSMFSIGPYPNMANTSNGWIVDNGESSSAATPSLIGPSSMAPVPPMIPTPTLPPMPHFPRTVSPEIPVVPKQLLVYSRRRKRESLETPVSRASKEMAGPSKKQKEVWADRCSHCDAQLRAIREELVVIQARLSSLYGVMLSYGEVKVLDDSAMSQMNARIQDLEMRILPMRWNVGPSDPYNRMG